MALRSPYNFEDRHPCPAASVMDQNQLINAIHTQADELLPFCQEATYQRSIILPPEPDEHSCRLTTSESIRQSARDAMITFCVPFGGRTAVHRELYYTVSLHGSNNVAVDTPPSFFSGDTCRPLIRIAENPGAPLEVQNLATIMRSTINKNGGLFFSQLWDRATTSLDTAGTRTACQAAYYAPDTPHTSVVIERELLPDGTICGENTAYNNRTIVNLPDGSRYARHTANGRIVQFRQLPPDVSYASSIIAPSRQELSDVSGIIEALIHKAYSYWDRERI